MQTLKVRFETARRYNVALCCGSVGIGHWRTTYLPRTRPSESLSPTNCRFNFEEKKTEKENRRRKRGSPLGDNRIGCCVDKIVLFTLHHVKRASFKVVVCKATCTIPSSSADIEVTSLNADSIQRDFLIISARCHKQIIRKMRSVRKTLEKKKLYA